MICRFVPPSSRVWPPERIKLHFVDNENKLTKKYLSFKSKKLISKEHSFLVSFRILLY